MKLLFALLLLTVSSTVSAGYTSEDDIKKEKEAKATQEETDRNNAPIDKTYWIVSNKEVGNRVEFFETFDKDEKELYKSPLKNKFYSNETRSFKVLEFTPIRYTSYLNYSNGVYKIIFDDGKEAYLPSDTLLIFGMDDPRKSLWGRISESTLTEVDNKEYLYSEDPRILKERASAAKRLASKHAANRPKKSGVRIGMTKKEVKASSWGKPRSINRTSNSSGTHEQWVYGENNYLYFDDDVLTTIQN